jgi:hypothetical protein
MSHQWKCLVWYTIKYNTHVWIDTEEQSTPSLYVYHIYLLLALFEFSFFSCGGGHDR